MRFECIARIATRIKTHTHKRHMHANISSILTDCTHSHTYVRCTLCARASFVRRCYTVIMRASSINLPELITSICARIPHAIAIEMCSQTSEVRRTIYCITFIRAAGRGGGKLKRLSHRPLIKFEINHFTEHLPHATHRTIAQQIEHTHTDTHTHRNRRSLSALAQLSVCN